MRGPLQLVLHINTACDSACRYCRWATLRRYGALKDLELSPVDVEGLLARYSEEGTSRQPYSWVIEVVVSSLGEALLHSQLSLVMTQLMDAVETNRVERLSLITNGSRLHKVGRLRYIPGFTSVSLDAAHAGLHHHLRPGVDHARILDNIGEAAEAARTNGVREVGIVMTVSKSNLEGIYDMIELAADLKVHYLHIVRGIRFDLAAQPADEEVPHDHPGVWAQVDSGSQRYPQLQVVNHFTPTGRPKGAPEEPHCGVPFNSLQVFPDGHVRLCCRAHDVDLGRWDEAQDPWQAERMAQVRHLLKERAPDLSFVAEGFAECGRCPLR